MIPPQELKKKSFSRSGKGYDTAEVDDYIDFIIKKYSEVYLQCDKYDKKLRIVSSRISEIQKEEEIIRNLNMSTQRNCDRLITEAEEEAKNTILRAREIAERMIADVKEKAQAALISIEEKAALQIDVTQQKSDALLLSARTRCARLLNDFKKEIAAQRENITNIKIISEEFNSKLLTMYKNHLNLLNENTFTPIIDLEGFTESKLYDSLMQEIKNDAAEIAKKSADVEYDFAKELDLLRQSRDAVNVVYDNSHSGGGDDDEDVKIAGVNYDGGSNYEADEDIKVFSKTTGSSGVAESIESSETSESNMYNEAPMATYDSDDYEYEGYGSQTSAGSSYSDEVYGIDGDDGDGVYDEDAFDDSGDLYEDEDENAGDSKGFFGLFKKKKKGGAARSYDIDDDDDDDDDISDDYGSGDEDDDDMDMFDDMEDDDEYD